MSVDTVVVVIVYVVIVGVVTVGAVTVWVVTVGIVSVGVLNVCVGYPVPHGAPVSHVSLALPVSPVSLVRWLALRVHGLPVSPVALVA